MTKVKTFTSPLKVFQTKEELDALDSLVNAFLGESPDKKCRLCFRHMHVG